MCTRWHEFNDIHRQAEFEFIDPNQQISTTPFGSMHIEWEICPTLFRKL